MHEMYALQCQPLRCLTTAIPTCTLTLVYGAVTLTGVHGAGEGAGEPLLSGSGEGEGEGEGAGEPSLTFTLV
jgi:hypothetical protein